MFYALKFTRKKNQICVLTEYNLSGCVYNGRYLKHLPISVTAISQQKPSQVNLFTMNLHEYMYNICASLSIKHRVGYHSCNFVNSRLEGARIEFRPGLRHSWVCFHVFFSDFSGKCRNNTTFRAWNISSSVSYSLDMFSIVKWLTQNHGASPACR